MFEFFFFFFQFSADVVACNRDPKTGVVKGLDTYNLADVLTNQVDVHQNNIVPFGGNYTGGRINCRYYNYC